jgi:hypothetical protein
MDIKSNSVRRALSPGGTTLHAAVATACLLALGATGCGGANKYDAVVTGTVTIEGELAPGGTVTFHPEGVGLAAYGRIHPDGSYSLRTGQGNLKDVDGGTIASGKYIATVVAHMPSSEGEVLGEGGPPKPGRHLTSIKVRSRETSPLHYTVQSGSNIFVLDVPSSISDPAEERATETVDGQQPTATEPEEPSAINTEDQSASPAPASTQTDTPTGTIPSEPNGEASPAADQPVVESPTGEQAAEQTAAEPTADVEPTSTDNSPAKEATP